LVESTIYVSVLICLVFVARAMLRGKLPAWWCYGLWLLLVIRMVMPWGLESEFSIFNYLPILSQGDRYMPFLMGNDLLPVFLADPEVSRDLAVTPKEHLWDRQFWHLSFDKALLVIWSLGVTVAFLSVLARNLRFWRIIRGESPVNDESILSLLKDGKSLLSIRREVAVIVTDRINSPALFGYLRPKLLLPPGILETLDRDELRYIFLHELGHLKRHDIGVSWLTAILQSIHWFNPLVWYAFYYLRVDQETACDAHVLSRIGRHQTTRYAQAILSLLDRFCQNRQLPVLAGILENKSQIKRRIDMITKFRKDTRRTTLISTVLLFAAALVFFTTASGLSTDKDDKIHFVYKDAYDLSPLVITGQAITQKTSEPYDHSGFSRPLQKALFEAQETLKTDDFAGARQILLDYLATEPKDVPAVFYQMLGYACSAEGNMEEAQKVFRDGHRAAPADGDLLLNYAISTWELGRLEEAASLFEEAYDTRQEKDTRFLLQAAVSWHKVRAFAESKRVLERLLGLKKDPESEWYRLIAIACMELGQYDEAKEHLEILRQRGELVEYAAKDPAGNDLSGSSDLLPTKTAYSLAEVDRPPKVVRSYDPLYPYTARKESIEGSVTLGFIVARDGNVVEPVVLKGEPPGVFDDSALRAIEQWKFEPAIKDGKPVDVVVVAPLNFRMDSNASHGDGT